MDLKQREKDGQGKFQPSTDGSVDFKDLGLPYQDSHHLQKVAEHQDLTPQVIERRDRQKTLLREEI